jgi:hypothetical protein
MTGHLGVADIVDYQKITLGDPGRARFGVGQAGEESATVRPITPGKRLPGS